MKNDVAWWAACWWLRDMAAPTFEHRATDAQASLAESIATRARRPSAAEAIRFAIKLQSLIEAQQEPPVILKTDLNGQGLLQEALDTAGFSTGSKAHLLSWYTEMWITDDEIVVRLGSNRGRQLLWRRQL